MKFNLKIDREVERARAYFEGLVAKGSLAEVKKLSPKRSLPQNNYLHLLLGAFAAHFGYTLEEAKTLYKRVSKDVYAYEKNGQAFLRSSADLSKEEMAKSVDRFREYSDEQGYPLPLATDTEWLRQLDNLIEQSRYYL